MNGKGKKARYDEERALLGAQLMNQLAILVKTSQIHDPGNVALVQPTQNVLDTLGGFFESDPE
ncbi:MAG: hypothetical protein ACREP8_09485, partial [Candidatus Binatia bacterium]